MNDERRRPDPSLRPDPYELAVRRAAEEPGREDDGPPPLPRLQAGPFRVGPVGLLVGVVALVVVGSLVRFSGGGAPAVAPSCTASGLTLSATRVRPGGLLTYALVGPDGPVVVGIDGASPATAVQTVPPVVLHGCAASGRFGVQAPPGEHRVTVFSRGRAVASTPVTVTEPGDPDLGH